MGDSVKKSEAMALAATISTLLLIPEAAEAVKQLILLAWAAGEGVIDIRSLLSGNKVPLVKTSDNWQLTAAILIHTGNEEMTVFQVRMQKKELHIKNI